MNRPDRIRLRSNTLTVAALFVAALALLRADRARDAGAASCEFDGVDRIVAVGDVHGAYDRFIEILRVTGLIDETLKWSGGKTHLVQLGDVVDRGPDSRKVLDFLKKLAREASSAGGRVHSLIGNHEAMRVYGDFRYVTPGEYAAFVTPDSEKVRKEFIDSKLQEEREQLLQSTPLGLVEMSREFARNGNYGSYLRDLNAVVKINGIVFLHGGISPEVASMSCKDINETVRHDLNVYWDKTEMVPQLTLTFGEKGPLWYRGLALEPDTFEPDVRKILTAQHARAIVVAHTVQTNGRIRSRFNGAVYLIDTGMQADYVPEGRASALEIRGDMFTAIYKDSREVLWGGAVHRLRERVIQ